MDKRMKVSIITKVISILILLVIIIGLSVNKTKTTKTTPIENNKTVKVNMYIKDYGKIEMELYPKEAPITVDNFIKLVNKGFYNNLTFHRVVKDFCIQGGDPNGDGTGTPGYTIKGEFKDNGINNNLKHDIGAVSMARGVDYNSGGCQFFIVTGEAHHLDGQYACFGKVVKGFDILKKINNVEVNQNDKPINPITIEKIEVQ